MKRFFILCSKRYKSSFSNSSSTESSARILHIWGIHTYRCAFLLQMTITNVIRSLLAPSIKCDYIKSRDAKRLQGHQKPSNISRDFGWSHDCCSESNRLLINSANACWHGANQWLLENLIETRPNNYRLIDNGIRTQVGWNPSLKTEQVTRQLRSWVGERSIFKTKTKSYIL